MTKVTEDEKTLLVELVDVLNRYPEDAWPVALSLLNLVAKQELEKVELEIPSKPPEDAVNIRCRLLQ